MKLQDIENKYGFKYPDLYKQLHEDGMLDDGDYDENYDCDGNPKLKDNPSLFFYSNDFEVMDSESVEDVIEFLRGPEDFYRKIKEEYTFIPFGRTGGGDYWGFLYGNSEENVPIVFLSYDPHITYLARNLQEFFFKMLLTDMSRKDIYSDSSDDEFIGKLKRVYDSHKKYLTDKQRNILQEILKRDIINHVISRSNGHEEEGRGLLTDLEMKKIFNEIIPFDKMDVTTFDYLDE